jgi:hypothetical protein
MPGSDKPKNTLPGAGESEADAAREVPFEKNPGAGPAGGYSKGAPDAAEAAGTKRKSGEEKEKAPPGATSPADLTTEKDDGAG